MNARLDGNMDIGTTCCICHEEITSFVNLSGKRCVWCQRTVHEFVSCLLLTNSECVDALGTYCDFGCHAPYIISPSYVESAFKVKRQSKEKSQPDTASSPAESKPVSSMSQTTSKSTLLRASSDHRESSLSSFVPLMPLIDPDSTSELRCRKGSEGSDGDDLSIGSSPPPNLTEYRIRENSDKLIRMDSDQNLSKDNRFSFYSIMKDLK